MPPVARYAPPVNTAKAKVFPTKTAKHPAIKITRIRNRAKLCTTPIVTKAISGIFETDPNRSHVSNEERKFLGGALWNPYRRTAERA
jgi:hypothetical protein